VKQLRVIAALCLFGGFSTIWASADEDWVRAVSDRDIPTLEHLVKSGVDVNLSTADGKTALMLAAQQGRKDLIRELLDAGAGINVTNTRGGTALMYAALAGDTASSYLLLERGAKVNSQSSNGWTALMIAAVKGYDELVSLLLDRGADPNLPDIYDWTPLMRAAYENRLAIVRTLLASKGVDLTAVNEYGATALHQSAERGYLQITQLLIDGGADPQAKDRDDRTPVMLARARGHVDVVDLLERSLERNVSR